MASPTKQVSLRVHASSLDVGNRGLKQHKILAPGLIRCMRKKTGSPSCIIMCCTAFHVVVIFRRDRSVPLGNLTVGKDKMP